MRVVIVDISVSAADGYADMERKINAAIEAQEATSRVVGVQMLIPPERGMGVFSVVLSVTDRCEQAIPKEGTDASR